MAKDTYYFSHDYNARTDIKIRRLISRHGMCGYGVFWAIVEDLYNNANALPTDYESIAFDLRTDLDTVKSIINDFDLFQFEGNSFGSSSIERRLDERNDKSKKARQSAFARWNKCERIANALQPQYEGNAIKESKGKEKKEKEINIPELSEFLGHAKILCERAKLNYAELAFSIESKYHGWVADGWKDGHGEKIKVWKTKLANTLPHLKPIKQQQKTDTWSGVRQA